MMSGLAEKIAALLPLAERNPAAMIQVARLMRKDGQRERALGLLQRALALAPDDLEMGAQVKRLLCEDVPWDFSLVRDEARAAACDAALRRAIRPGSRVLEIGTGTGLFAMMAARAGAAEVISCEMNPVIAQAAGRIVARNGYAPRVRVIAKRSDQLDLDEDLGGRVDILVSEIVSNNLLSEGVLLAHEHAVRNFLKPGGRVIPARGAVRVALAEDRRDDEHRLGEIDGFDLSPFNALARPVRQIRVGSERLTLRSEGVDLFAFDLGSGEYSAPGRASVACRSTGGRVNGIAQWISLQMDAEGCYENRPAPGATSSWASLFHLFPCPIDTLPGQEIGICGSHDRHHVLIWPEAA